MTRTILTTIAVVMMSCTADARVQGSKGRTTTLFQSLTPYRGGDIIIEPTLIQSSYDRVLQNVRKHKRDRLVDVEHVRLLTEGFLATRFRDILTMTVRVQGRRGPLEPSAVVRTLVAQPAVQYQSRGKRILVIVDFYDGTTGDLIAVQRGFGRASIRGMRGGARDDLQEIARVLAADLAIAIGVDPPGRKSFHPEPYTRRGRERVAP